MYENLPFNKKWNIFYKRILISLIHSIEPLNEIQKHSLNNHSHFAILGL